MKHNTIIFFFITILFSFSTYTMDHIIDSVLENWRRENSKSYAATIAGTPKELVLKSGGRYTLQTVQESVIKQAISNDTAANIVTGVTDGAIQEFFSSFVFGPANNAVTDSLKRGAVNGMQRGAFVFSGEMLMLASNELLQCIEKGSVDSNLPEGVKKTYQAIMLAKKEVIEYHQMCEQLCPKITKTATSIGRKVTRDVAAYCVYAMMCKASGGEVKASSFYKLAGYGL